MSTEVDSLVELFSDMSETYRDIDYRPLLEDFMPVIAAQESSMFANETDSNGSSWAPLKPSVVKRKGNDRILVDTGALISSLVNIGDAGNIHDVFDHGLTFGTDIEYASLLQDGTKRMPARPPVGISEETIDGLCEQVADYVVEQLRG